MPPQWQAVRNMKLKHGHKDRGSGTWLVDADTSTDMHRSSLLLLNLYLGEVKRSKWEIYTYFKQKVFVVKHQWGRTVCPFSGHKEMSMTKRCQKVKMALLKLPAVMMQMLPREHMFSLKRHPTHAKVNQGIQIYLGVNMILNVCLVHIFVFAVLQQEDSLQIVSNSHKTKINK